MQTVYYEYLGLIDLYNSQYISTTINNSGTTDAIITNIEYSPNVYPEPIQLPILIPVGQDLNIGAYIVPIYPYDNTNEFVKLSGYYYDNNGNQQNYEITIYYQYTGKLFGKLLRFDVKNIPYFKDNLSFIIEYVPEDYTFSKFIVPDLVLIKYGNIEVYELGKIFPISNYIYAYIFNNNKLKDSYDPLKTAKMLLINKNNYDLKIKRIIYRDI